MVIVFRFLLEVIFKDKRPSDQIENAVGVIGQRSFGGVAVEQTPIGHHRQKAAFLTQLLRQSFVKSNFSVVTPAQFIQRYLRQAQLFGQQLAQRTLWRPDQGYEAQLAENLRWH